MDLDFDLNLIFKEFVHLLCEMNLKIQHIGKSGESQGELRLETPLFLRSMLSILDECDQKSYSGLCPDRETERYLSINLLNLFKKFQHCDNNIYEIWDLEKKQACLY